MPAHLVVIGARGNYKHTPTFRRELRRLGADEPEFIEPRRGADPAPKCDAIIGVTPLPTRVIHAIRRQGKELSIPVAIVEPAWSRAKAPLEKLMAQLGAVSTESAPSVPDAAATGIAEAPAPLAASKPTTAALRTLTLQEAAALTEVPLLAFTELLGVASSGVVGERVAEDRAEEIGVAWSGTSFGSDALRIYRAVRNLRRLMHERETGEAWTDTAGAERMLRSSPAEVNELANAQTIRRTTISVRGHGDYDLFAVADIKQVLAREAADKDAVDAQEPPNHGIDRDFFITKLVYVGTGSWPIADHAHIAEEGETPVAQQAVVDIARAAHAYAASHNTANAEGFAKLATWFLHIQLAYRVLGDVYVPWSLVERYVGDFMHTNTLKHLPRRKVLGVRAPLYLYRLRDLARTGTRARVAWANLPTDFFDGIPESAWRAALNAPNPQPVAPKEKTVPQPPRTSSSHHTESVRRTAALVAARRHAHLHARTQ